MKFTLLVSFLAALLLSGCAGEPKLVEPAHVVTLSNGSVLATGATYQKGGKFYYQTTDGKFHSK